ncbi:MAG: hypothetical protein FVQ79_02190 [Planctomycetes bacterium]|nr:hypothetical protein [Planctomycetota bacterium]
MVLEQIYSQKKNDAPAIRLVQNKMPDSTEEWYWALATYDNDWGTRFSFQLPIGGGTAVRGGMIIDFLYYTPMVATPVFIDGFYWHSVPALERFQRSQVPSLLGAEYGIFAKAPISISSNEIDTLEKVREKFLEIIGPA